MAILRGKRPMPAPKKPQLALCTNHDCPAIHSCAQYVAYNIAPRDPIYFRPAFNPKSVPPCRYYSEWKATK